MLLLVRASHRLLPQMEAISSRPITTDRQTFGDLGEEVDEFADFIA
jgi:hypothetical protein